jgi:hypothetical protein
MWRFLPVWVGWLILETIFLRGAAAFFPDDSSFPRSSPTASAFVQAGSDSDDVLFTEPFSVSRELSLLCQREHKQNCSLTSAVDSLPRVHERADWWSAVQRVAPLFTLFCFPRKLSPLSAEDGPFPSQPLTSCTYDVELQAFPLLGSNRGGANLRKPMACRRLIANKREG